MPNFKDLSPSARFYLYMAYSSPAMVNIARWKKSQCINKIRLYASIIRTTYEAYYIIFHFPASEIPIIDVALVLPFAVKYA